MHLSDVYTTFSATVAANFISIFNAHLLKFMPFASISPSVLTVQNNTSVYLM